MNLLSDMGGRKFMFAILVVALAYGAMLFGKMDANQWKDLVIWALGIFSVANVTQGVSNTVTDMVSKTRTNPPAA